MFEFIGLNLNHCKRIFIFYLLTFKPLFC